METPWRQCIHGSGPPISVWPDGGTRDGKLEVYPGLVLYGPPFWPDLVVSGKRVSEHRDAKVTTSTV